MPIISTSGEYVKVIEDFWNYYLLSSGNIVSIAKENYIENWFSNFTCPVMDCSSNGELIYLATSGAGVCVLEKPLIVSGNYELFPIYKHNRISNYLSEIVFCIDSNNKNIAIGTNSGIELNLDTEHYSCGIDSPVTSVVLTSNNDLYYGGSFGLAVKKGPISGNWVSPTYRITTSSNPAIYSNIINDICVLEDGGINYVAIATNSGCYYYKETFPLQASNFIKLFSDTNYIAESGTVNYPTLSGGSPIFNSIEIMDGYNLINRSLLIAGSGFQSLDVFTGQVIAYYSEPVLETNRVVDF